MLFHETASGPVAISQPAHAWVSGQIMRAWGNAAFGAAAPFEDVCLAAEQHDMGWLEWETAPTLNPATRRPHAFREMRVADHTAIWSRGTRLALTLGRYPALLVSLHGTALYANHTSTRTEDVAIVRGFLDAQATIQARLIDGLRADGRYDPFCAPEAIERNRGLVRAADRMSLAICTAMQDLAVRTDDPRTGIVRQVPSLGGEVDVVLRIADGDAVTVAPWPFKARAVSLACEGTVLPAAGFTQKAEMLRVLATGARVAIAAELRPG